MKRKMSYSIYSISDDKKDADGTGQLYGKWKLVKFIVKNPFKNTYKNRNKIEISLYNM